MNQQEIREIINDLKYQIQVLSWYPEDVEKQKVALRRIEFIAVTALMDMDYSTEEGN